ncbi:phosphatase PAP2 family protein [Pseudonocardia nigra]|uniref:phosphatase PAP2 family protein n=1 Tax=Pseudonocardia nigra TaxID=1921578 RepID=UPI0027E22989|nr:phosphatase PAP2 family protein [Pseudonocardia nigra]
MAELLDRPGPPAAPIFEPDGTIEVPPATAELRVLSAVQQTIGTPPVVRVARGMSLFGEHAAGWLVFGAVAALVDRGRRREWLTAAAGVAVAHGASVGVKRVVRRPRPEDPRVKVLVGTPSRLSFPSAHATSTTAAAVLYGRLLRKPLVAALVPPMALSRMVLGVHYPSDVVAGSLLGAAVAALARRASRKGNR